MHANADALYRVSPSLLPPDLHSLTRNAAPPSIAQLSQEQAGFLLFFVL